MAKPDVRSVPNATKDKSKVGKAQKGNPTVTDVPSDLLSNPKSQNPSTGSTIAGEGKRPAASTGTSDVAPIVKQNQDTDFPAISMTPPVYGHADVMDLNQKDPWKEARAKAEHRYGKLFLEQMPKARQDELVEAEYRRLHNGSLDEDHMTAHATDDRLE